MPGERYNEARISDFSPRIEKFVAAWLANPGDGLFLYGKAGTGKTHLACAIVRYGIERAKRMRFHRAEELYQAIRTCFRRDSEESEATVLAQFKDAAFLVLDDLGAGSLSDMERRYTHEVLEQRLNKRRPTIITTNWSIDDIAHRMDERIASRISGYSPLQFTGSDRRKNNVTA